MGISLRKFENSGVVVLTGSVGLEQLRMMDDYVDLLLSNHVTTIYFDFSDVRALSVSALGTLSGIRDRVDGQGGRLMLAGLRDGLNRLVDMEHLRRFFTLFDGELPKAEEADDEAPREEALGGNPVGDLPGDGGDADGTGFEIVEAD